MTLRYELSGQVWRHSFSAVALDEAQVKGLLQDSGFSDFCWHGEHRLWATAVAAG